MPLIFSDADDQCFEGAVFLGGEDRHTRSFELTSNSLSVSSFHLYIQACWELPMLDHADPAQILHLEQHIAQIKEMISLITSPICNPTREFTSFHLIILLYFLQPRPTCFFLFPNLDLKL